MERGLEWGVEGWVSPLIWKVWCEWRTSGSPRWWILPLMLYGKVIRPSFIFSLPPHPLPQPSISPARNHHHPPPHPSPLALINSSFLLPRSLRLLWMCFNNFVPEEKIYPAHLLLTSIWLFPTLRFKSNCKSITWPLLISIEKLHYLFCIKRIINKDVWSWSSQPAVHYKIDRGFAF